MVSTDLVAELRAEVARWWDGLHKQQMAKHQAESGSHGNAMLSPILGAMLGDGPIRMITLGQELTVDMDEKSLGELQFKDNQVVQIRSPSISVCCQAMENLNSQKSVECM
jgi:ubiquitin carboxyl-terminal hydrolase 34